MNKLVTEYTAQDMIDFVKYYIDLICTDEFGIEKTYENILEDWLELKRDEE